jgi:uncharacterized protein YcfJ
MPIRFHSRAGGIPAAAVAILLLVEGCAGPPGGPTVAVLPGNGKSFQAFQTDDAVCRQFASQQVAGQAESANAQGVGGALLGTVLGAGLGAAIGGGRGAGIGAAGGALGGTAIGAASTQNAQVGIQQQYNIAYMQCMYTKGNQVPGYAGGPVAYPPPPAVYYPPGY